MCLKLCMLSYGGDLELKSNLWINFCVEQVLQETAASATAMERWVPRVEGYVEQ